MAESVNPPSDKEIFPYPGKPRSTAWKFFGFHKLKEGPPSKENLDMSTVICKLCCKSYANKGNTTNLQQHLDKHHRNDPSIPQTSASSSCSPPPHTSTNLKKEIQPRINDLLTKPTGRVSKEKKFKLDDLLRKLVVSKCLPLSLVDSSHFKDFVRELDPRYALPSKYEVKKALAVKNTSMTEKLCKDLPPAEGNLAITHDSWTSMATQSYDTITAHFISNNWELHSAVLQTTKVEGSHTSERIAERLQEAVTKWNLPIPTVVTDNAANEKKAVEELLGWDRFGCYGHRLNLAVKHALDVNEVSRILGKSRKIVTLFHQSTSLSDCLLDKQRLVYPETPSLIGLKLVADVQTRWNSSLAMLRRLAQQSAAKMAVASDKNLNINKTTTKNLRSFCPTFDEQTIVENLIKLLEPFEKATVILCAENAPTMHKVLVCMAKINRTLEIQLEATSSACLRKVILNLQEQLAKRAFSEKIPTMAALLNPDTRSLAFLPEHAQTTGHTMLLNEALALIDHNGNFKLKVKKEKSGSNDSVLAVPITSVPELPVPELPNLPDFESGDIVHVQAGKSATLQTDIQSDANECEPAPKRVRCSDMDDWFDDVVITGVSKKPSFNVVQEEVQRYLGSGRHENDSDLSLLQWWSQNEAMYPRLSVLARKYLAIPASSVPSERVFSLAGALVSKRRSRMNPDMVDSLIFLKMNMGDYW